MFDKPVTKEYKMVLERDGLYEWKKLLYERKVLIDVHIIKWWLQYLCIYVHAIKHIFM